MKAGAGHPMGPLTLADFVGLDTLGSICDVHVRRVPRAPLRASRRRCARCSPPAGTAGSPAWASTTTRARSPSRTPGSRDERRATSQQALERARAGGPERHRAKSAEQGKLPVRERIALLLDDGSFVEEALLANWEQDGLGADGVVTGLGHGRRPPGLRHGQRPDGEGRLVGPEDRREDHPHPGARAAACACRWSTSSTRAGARITDQVQMFPGRRGAGRIFHTEVKMSGRRPAGLRAVRPERRRAARTSPRSATS